MSWLESILASTPRLEARPTAFGAFHLISCAIVLLLFIFMIMFRKHLPRGERALRVMLVAFGVGLLFLEIGKQILYSYDSVEGWAYNWERFPFQFCSTPIYIALIAMCMKDCKIRRALVAFLATYSPVAGASVLIYPSRSVFHEIIFFDVHTMVWHGLMLLFGLYLWLSEAVAPTWKTALRAAIVYAPMNFIALALNEASYAFGFAAGYDFNMFYTGRLGRCFIPVLSDIQATYPYPVFFTSYVIVLGVGGLLVTIVMMLLDRLANRMPVRQEEKNG